MAVVQNMFSPMLTMSRLAMITTREPQEEMIISCLSARKFRPQNIKYQVSTLVLDFYLD